MIKSKKYYLAKTKGTANTFIGGVGATINTAALAASKLGISASRIKAFSVIGENIQFAVTGGSYTIANNAFLSDTSITTYDDIDGLCTTIGASAFQSSTLNWCNFPNASTIGNRAFNNVNFTSDVYFPAWVISSGGTTVYGTFLNAKFTNFYAVNLTTLTNLNHFQGVEIIGEMVLSSLTSIGSSPSNANAVFTGMYGGGVLKVPAALATVNSGSPDPDLATFGNNVLVDYIGYIDDGSFNTEINISTSYTKMELAVKLVIPNAYIFNYSQVGNLIRFKHSGAVYGLPNNVFVSNTSIATYNDIDGKCISLGQNAFDNSTLNWCNFPAVNNIRRYAFRNVNFTSDVSFPALIATTTADGTVAGSFYGTNFTNFYAVNFTTTNGSNVFYGCTITGEMVLSSLSSIGSPSTNSNCFYNLTGGGVLKVPVALATVNSGSPDPDITPAIMGVSVLLVYI